MTSHWMMAVGLPMIFGGWVSMRLFGGDLIDNTADLAGAMSMLIGGMLLTLGVSAKLVGY